MKAYRALTPGTVHWFSTGEPDYAAAGAPYPPGELADITVSLVVPTPGGPNQGGIGSGGVELMTREDPAWFTPAGAYATRTMPLAAQNTFEGYAMVGGGGVLFVDVDAQMQGDTFIPGVAPSVV